MEVGRGQSQHRRSARGRDCSGTPRPATTSGATRCRARSRTGTTPAATRSTWRCSRCRRAGCGGIRTGTSRTTTPTSATTCWPASSRCTTRRPARSPWSAPGEALTFRERTWHYGYNFTQVETVIICTFAPVPEDISSAAVLAAAVPPLDEVRPGRWDLTGEAAIRGMPIEAAATARASASCRRRTGCRSSRA